MWKVYAATSLTKLLGWSIKKPCNLLLKYLKVKKKNMMPRMIGFCHDIQGSEFPGFGSCSANTRKVPIHRYLQCVKLSYCFLAVVKYK